MKKFVSQFVDIKKLEMKFERMQSTILELLWKEFQPLIIKHNVFTEVEIDVWWCKDYIDRLSRLVMKNILTPNKLSFHLHDSNKNAMIKLLQHSCQHVEWLKVYLTLGHDNISPATLESFINFCKGNTSDDNGNSNNSINTSSDSNRDKGSFPCLKILDMSSYDTDMKTINEFINVYSAGITTHAKQSEASHASAKRVRSEFRTKKMWCEFCASLCEFANSHYFKFKYKTQSYAFNAFKTPNFLNIDS